MIEFELYTRILSPDFLCKNQNVLTEHKSGQKANLTIKGIDEYRLYRFDVEDGKDFLPFFNKTHDEAPKGLGVFCDYIILACLKSKLFIILVEMKTGNTHNAQQQLEASALFMDYIKNSAIRIKKLNNYHDFNANNVMVKKLILKQGPKVKCRPTTQSAKKSNIDWNASPITLRDNSLPIRKNCGQ